MAASRNETYGGVVCQDPAITIGKRSHFLGQPLGLLSRCPGWFKDRPSYNLLTLAWTHEEADAADALARDLDQAARDLPLARVLVLANTRAELAMLRSKGIASIESNLLMFCNESVFYPVPGAHVGRFDALYTAGLEPYKRHELAARVRNLMLLYWPAAPSGLAAVRQALPKAHFTNHERSEGGYRFYVGRNLCRLMSEARVGLCLSQAEGPMRASMEYALCGLPVVSTHAKGGRIEMQNADHISVVDPDPDAIAAAVDAMIARDLAPEVVRAAALAGLEAKRQVFLGHVADWLKAEGGAGLSLPSFESFLGINLSRTRDPLEIFAQ
jgi:hypothetical protein